MFRKSLFVSRVALVVGALFFMFCGDEGTPDYCGDGHPLNSTTQFCFGDETFDKCGGNTYDPTAKFCYDERLYDRCNGLTFNPVERFCFANVTYELCNGETWTPPNNPCISNATKFMLTVNANPSNGGTVSPSATTPYDSGTTINVTATASDGYQFIGWTGTPDGVNSNDRNITFNINNTTTLTAVFHPINTDGTPIIYSLTTTREPSVGGTITREPNQPAFESGTEVTLTAIASDGYEFIGWDGSLESTNNVFTFEVLSNMNMTANFKRVHTLTINKNLPIFNGRITVDGVATTGITTHDNGVSVQVCVEETAGFSFTSWTGALSVATPCVTVTMDGNKTLNANFLVVGTPSEPLVIGNRTYRTVTIGTQTWMAENLNYGTRTGSTCYENTDSYCNTYGRLYDWETAVAVCEREIGNSWRLPSNDDWQILIDAVGGEEIAGTKLKSSTGWEQHSSTPIGTNEYGFSALPGGDLWDNYFSSVGESGVWWTATEYGTNAWMRAMGYEYESVYSGVRDRANRFSVRCVRD